MATPTIIQTKALSKVFTGNEIIIPPQTIAPRIGTKGTNGVLNGRSRLGLFRRRIHTPRLTNTKAKSVPILVKSPATLPGINPPKIPTKANRIMLDLYGVLKVG